MQILRLVLECETPLHCGGGNDEVLDQPVIRDAFGLWRIPGSTIAGSLRALGNEIDEKLTCEVFGEQTGDESRASLMWCEDGLLVDFDGQPAIAKILQGHEPEIKCETFVRDHVCLDLETGTGIEGGKFDMEFVPAGARFLLELRCDGWQKELTQAQIDYCRKLFAQVLAGKLELGGKSGLGYGKYKIISREYGEIDLTAKSGMAAWLDQPDYPLPNPDKSQPLPTANAATPKQGLNGGIEIPLVCNGPILIGGGNALRPDNKIGEADMLFALTPRLDYAKKAIVWQAVLPASSIKGVLRHAIYKILKSLGAANAKKMLDQLFGYVGHDDSQCGKLVVCDAILGEYAPNSYQTVQHVALDRFTSAAINGALFNEEPFWLANTAVALKLAVNDLNGAEAALFFHAVCDLCEGALAVGSGVNRGNGRLALPNWPQSLDKIKGDLNWAGEAVLANLQNLAPLWDKALQERIAQ